MERAWVIVAVTAAFVLGMYSDGNISIPEEVEEELREEEPRGGAEVDIPDVVPAGFPIHAEDYVRLTSPFGRRVSPILGVEMDHIGLDIETVWRARVVAIAPGEVVEHWPAPDGYYKGHRIYGGMVRIDHGEYETVYAHLHETFVHTGQHVSAGSEIGRVGGTGIVDGEHLHFEVRVNGQPVNPLLYISHGNISIGVKE